MATSPTEAARRILTLRLAPRRVKIGLRMEWHYGRAEDLSRSPRCVLIFSMEGDMTYLRAIMLAAFFLSMLASGNDADAEAIQPLTPQAAQEYAADAEKADSGDPEAAYRMGEALASGRIGGLKDLHKALGY